jgi:hypothetical protein
MPSKANSFCCVCKVNFEDYLTHVTLPSHISLMRSSPYCADIKDLCQIYATELPAEPLRKPKSKGIRKPRTPRKLAPKLTSYPTATSLTTQNEVLSIN